MDIALQQMSTVVITADDKIIKIKIDDKPAYRFTEDIEVSIRANLSGNGDINIVTNVVPVVTFYFSDDISITENGTPVTPEPDIEDFCDQLARLFPNANTGSGGSGTVTTDATLTGDGSAGAPLSVADPLTTDKENYWNDAAAVAFTGTNRVISGNAIWNNGLTFDIIGTVYADLVYTIQGTRYEIANTQVTLAPADATNDRIDVIYFDTAGLVGVLTGTPAANPEKPVIDSNTQVELTHINVPANATELNSSDLTIYDENTEFSVASTNGTVDANDTTAPYSNSKDISCGAFVNNDNINFTSGSLHDVSQYQNLVFKIQLKATFTNNAYLTVLFANGTNPVSTQVSVTNNTFGYNRTIVGSYQVIAIPLSAFTFSDTQFNRIYFVMHGNNASGFYLDQIVMQGGVPVSQQNGVQSFNGRSGNVTAQSDDYAVGQITGALANDLADGKIFVGDGTNKAAAVTPSQDAVITNAGAVTVQGLLTKSLPALAAGYLKYSGSAFSFDNSVSGGNGLGWINVKDYGATVGDGQIVYDATITSGTNLVNSASGLFVAGDVGKIFNMRGAGTSGQEIVGTILAVNSATQVQISVTATTTVASAGKFMWGTDCTAEIQQAIQDAIDTNARVVYFPSGVYVINGPLQTSVGGVNPNCQIYIPSTATKDDPTRGALHLIGQAAYSTTPNGRVADFTVPKGGTILWSTLSAASGTNPSMFGGKGVAGMGNSEVRQDVYMKNMTVMVNGNPAGGGPVVGGCNFYNLSSAMLEDVLVTTNQSILTSVSPTNEVAGVVFPAIDYEHNSTWYRGFVNGGFKYGCVVGEHLEIVQSAVLSCYYGLIFSGFSHPAHADRLLLAWNKYQMYVPTTTILNLTSVGYCVFNADIVSFEAQIGTGRWNDQTFTILDTGNNLHGHMIYFPGHGGVGYDATSFTKSGGNLYRCNDIMTPWANLSGSVGITDLATTTDTANYVLTVVNSSTGLIKKAALGFGGVGTVTAQRLLGRYSATNGGFQEITIGTGLNLDNTTGELTASGGGGTGGLVDSVANLDGTLTISPTTGNVIASLNLANANTWTGAITAQKDNIGTTSTDGIILANTTAAASGSQQYSPRLHFKGQGWKTNATAASQSVDLIQELQPVQGSSAPTGLFTWNFSINGGGYSSKMSLDSAGLLNVPALQTGTSGNYGIGIGNGVSTGSGQLNITNIGGTKAANIITTYTQSASTSVSAIQCNVTANTTNNPASTTTLGIETKTGVSGILASSALSNTGIKSWIQFSTAATSVGLSKWVGIESSIQLNNPSGNITTAYGVNINVTQQNSPGGIPTGKIGTWIGIKVEPVDANFFSTSNYGIWQEGSGAKNRLEGKLSVGVAADPTAFLTVAACTTSAASMNISSGTTPSSPNNGDIWFDGTHLYCQIGGVAKQLDN